MSNCTSLQEINVDIDNSHYCSINGVLFNKSITKLIKYPAGKTDSEYEIPQSVYEISDWAFIDCKSIEVIKSNSKIKRLGKGVFNNCSNLRRCNIQIDESADAESSWNLGDLFPLKSADSETKLNGYNGILKAASMEHSHAQFYLARCYEYGWNGEISIYNYLLWLKRSAYNGCYKAMSRLSREYITGKNTSKDYKKAYTLLHQLEESGKDAENACKGNFYALLGNLFKNGFAVKQDFKTAVDYFIKGTKWKDWVAESMLAECYKKGIGVDVALYKADEYYTLAKNHKLQGTAEALDRVERKLKDTADDLSV